MKKLLIIFTILCIILTSSCLPDEEKRETIISNVDIETKTVAVEYSLVEIEGLDCIMVVYGYSMGLTCDWENWNK